MHGTVSLAIDGITCHDSLSFSSKLVSVHDDASLYCSLCISAGQDDRAKPGQLNTHTRQLVHNIVDDCGQARVPGFHLFDKIRQ